jgi:hypothetical protein
MCINYCVNQCTPTCLLTLRARIRTKTVKRMTRTNPLHIIQIVILLKYFCEIMKKYYHLFHGSSYHSFTSFFISFSTSLSIFFPVSFIYASIYINFIVLILPPYLSFFLLFLFFFRLHSFLFPFLSSFTHSVWVLRSSVHLFLPPFFLPSFLFPLVRFPFFLYSLSFPSILFSLFLRFRALRTFIHLLLYSFICSFIRSFLLSSFLPIWCHNVPLLDKPKDKYASQEKHHSWRSRHNAPSLYLYTEMKNVLIFTVNQ